MDSAVAPGDRQSQSPIRLLEIDLGAGLSDIEPEPGERGYPTARVLVRRFGRVLGILDVPTPLGRLGASGVAAAVEAQLGVPAGPGESERDRADHAFLAQRRDALASAPPASVVLCTRGRPQQLPDCLRSLLRLQYPQVDLLVVDNGSPEDGVEQLMREVAADVLGDAGDAHVSVRVVVEPRPGLSRARNTGVHHARGDFIAFTDDDAEVDPEWLTQLWQALASAAGAGCATGLVLPAELETQAQIWFEEFGGHSKGRALVRQVIDPVEKRAQHPLYPLPAFGAGVNMAFRREVLEEAGGFDPALGAGSPAGGSEDTAMFSQALLNGHSIVFTPHAIVRHHHRPGEAALRSQYAGYGRGLTAYYTKMLLERPRLALELARLAPTALRDLLSADSMRNAPIPADFPRDITRGEVRGMLRGPAAYLRGRRRERSADAERAAPREPVSLTP